MKATCVTCGKEFDKRHNKKTCGPACAQQLKRDYQNAYYLRADRQEIEAERGRRRWAAREQIKAACVVCGGEFAKTNRSMICSDDCRERLRQRWGEPKAIDPFPTDLNPDAFGHWLSGFTDGEGSFTLRAIRSSQKLDQPSARFAIALRADDAEVLNTIRSYFDCGTIRHFDNRRSKIPNAKPVVAYYVTSAADLIATIIPHFERFPLRAKKRNDFAIWRAGVLVLAEAQSRPQMPRPGGGFFPKWTDEERQRFASLVAALRGQREYVHEIASELDAPASRSATQRALFDSDD